MPLFTFFQPPQFNINAFQDKLRQQLNGVYTLDFISIGRIDTYFCMLISATLCSQNKEFEFEFIMGLTDEDTFIEEIKTALLADIDVKDTGLESSDLLPSLNSPGNSSTPGR